MPVGRLRQIATTLAGVVREYPRRKSVGVLVLLYSSVIFVLVSVNPGMPVISLPEESPSICAKIRVFL